MVGRPVRFVGAESEEDQTFALSRLAAGIYGARALSGWSLKWNR